MSYRAAWGLLRTCQEQFGHDLVVMERGRGTRLTPFGESLVEMDGAARAAPFRDRIGGGRKVAIQILEFFDRVGYLRRVRDDHLPRRENPWRESGAEVNSAPRQHAADQRGRVT